MICGLCRLDCIRGIKEWTAHTRVCPRGPDGGWYRVVALKARGQHDEAAEVAADLMGVEGPKMSDQQKAYLRAYSASPEAKARARERRQDKAIQAKVARMREAELERRAHGSQETHPSRKGGSKQVRRKG